MPSQTYAMSPSSLPASPFTLSCFLPLLSLWSCQLAPRSTPLWSRVISSLTPNTFPTPTAYVLVLLYFFLNIFPIWGLFTIKHIQIFIWVCFSEHHSYISHETMNFLSPIKGKQWQNDAQGLVPHIPTQLKGGKCLGQLFSAREWESAF